MELEPEYTEPQFSEALTKDHGRVTFMTTNRVLNPYERFGEPNFMDEAQAKWLLDDGTEVTLRPQELYTEIIIVGDETVIRQHIELALLQSAALIPENARDAERVGIALENLGFTAAEIANACFTQGIFLGAHEPSEELYDDTMARLNQYYAFLDGQIRSRGGKMETTMFSTDFE